MLQGILSHSDTVKVEKPDYVNRKVFQVTGTILCIHIWINIYKDICIYILASTKYIQFYL